MALPAITEEEILALLEKHPEGRSLEELAALVHKVFPIGIMGQLVRAGKIITVGHHRSGFTAVNRNRNRYGIWGYRHRLSATEWLRRQPTYSAD